MYAYVIIVLVKVCNMNTWLIYALRKEFKLLALIFFPAYIYPDFVTSLVGQFNNGVMQGAQQVSKISSKS